MQKIDPFPHTLELIQSRLSSLLSPDFTRIWVQGSHKPNQTSLVFTIFPKMGLYSQEFFNLKNFRLFKEEGDLEIENKFIDGYVSQIQPILSKYLK